MTVTSEQLIGTIEPLNATREARLVPFRAQVQRHLLAMVRDKSLAEELTQDTYARALSGSISCATRRPRWPGCTESRPRLRSTGCGNRDPRRCRSTPSHRPAARPSRRQSVSVRPPCSRARSRAPRMSAWVQGYLAALPDDYRIAILLHDAHGLSSPEIAELLGCSQATAKIRVHRARTRLRETLSSACTFEIDERGVLVCDPQPGTRTSDVS